MEGLESPFGAGWAACNAAGAEGKGIRLLLEAGEFCLSAPEKGGVTLAEGGLGGLLEGLG